MNEYPHHILEGAPCMALYAALSVCAAASFLLAPPVALAFDDTVAKDTGFNLQTFAAGFNGIQDPSAVGLIDSIINIINALLVLAAIASNAFMIVSGVRYLASQGDEDAVAQAKNAVIFVIVGTIVILLAVVIVNFFIAQIG
jgi:hypothetical protein